MCFSEASPPCSRRFEVGLLGAVGSRLVGFKPGVSRGATLVKKGLVRLAYMSRLILTASSGRLQIITPLKLVRSAFIIINDGPFADTYVGRSRSGF